MYNINELRSLTSKEKLMIIETLWNDLAESSDNISSPEWHKQILHETKERFKRGEISVEDWKSAKKKLREKF